MTHSLHRQGTRESLSRDFCIMCVPEPGYNHLNANERASRFLDIVLRYSPANYGVISCGNMYTHDRETIRKALDQSPAIFCVLTSEEALEGALRELKEQDLGLSVVVSALYDLVAGVCRKVGLDPHTVNHSLGVWGKTGKLPPGEVLEIATMCGHAQVSASLVESLMDSVKKGKISAREAAIRMARPCVCGFFNPQRAERLMGAEGLSAGK